MTAATADMHAWLAALTLPPATAVQQRIPKKMLTEHAAATAADRKLVQERIDTVTWHASLKPGNVGVAAYEDALRCYLEIAVLTLQLRPAAEQRQALHSSPGSIRRLAELIHRAIPYPVVLLIEAGHELFVSMAHIRWAQRETGKTVLDGEPILASVTPPAEHNPMLGAYRQFLLALNLGKQPHAHMLALYQTWFDTLSAWQVATLSGHFRLSATPEQAEERRAALFLCRELDERIAATRRTAAREKQVARQVAINLELKALLAERERVAQGL